MILHKIKWCVSKQDKHTYVITSEVCLGSARYTEFFCVSRQEVEYGQHTGDSSTLWKIIEKMQWNMLDALGCYENQTGGRK